MAGCTRTKSGGGTPSFVVLPGTGTGTGDGGTIGSLGAIAGNVTELQENGQGYNEGCTNPNPDLCPGTLLFFRIEPGYECGNVLKTPSYYGKLRCSYTHGFPNCEFLADSCTTTTSGTYTSSQLDWSAYDPDYLGLNAGIYQREPVAPPTAVGSPFTEVFCRTVGATPTDGMDIAVRFTSATTSRLATIYIGQKEAKSTATVQYIQTSTIPGFDVTLEAGETDLVYANAALGLESLDVKKTARADGKHDGHLKAVINQATVEKDLDCRVTQPVQ